MPALSRWAIALACAAVLEPETVLEERQELAGDVPVLARQVADLLLHEVDSVEVLGPAHQDGVAEQHAVLGAADGDDVGVADGLPG